MFHCLSAISTLSFEYGHLAFFLPSIVLMFKFVIFHSCVFCRKKTTYKLNITFIPCFGIDLRHVPLAQHWLVTVHKIAPVGLVVQ